MSALDMQPTVFTSRIPNTSGADSGATERLNFDLSRLIDPVTFESFISDYWEKRPLVISRRNPSYFGRLLTLSDVDHLLAHSKIQSSEIRLVRNGQETPLTKLKAEGANRSTGSLEALYQEYRGGSTINFLFLQERWPPLKSLCRSIAAQLSARVQVNVYLTPSGEQALDTHYDTHDVFVLQSHGTKRWRIYDSPFQLPLPMHPYRATQDLEVGQPAHEFILEPGDLIYIPRGYLHDAESLESTSLHLTVGIKSLAWASVLVDAVYSAIDRDPRLRESLPPGFATNEHLRTNCELRLSELVASVLSKVDPKVVIDEAVNKAMLAVYPTLEGHLLDLEDERSVNLETSLQRRVDVPWHLAADDEHADLRFHGKIVRMPAYAKQDLQFIASSERFSANELPGVLDPSSRLVLVRRLLKEGFVTICRP